MSWTPITEDWRVRWEVAQRADAAVLGALRGDPDVEVRRAVRERGQAIAGAAHG